MSVQGSQWVRRSPSSKQGPLKATLPVSSLTRQNNSIKEGRSKSPSLSPSVSCKVRISPDTNISGLRSPGAVNYKGKNEALRPRVGPGYVPSMRRTASLDTIYLTGQWPRESLYLSNLQVDRSTQTEDWYGDPRKVLRHQDSGNEDKLEKLIRHRMQRTKEGSSRERTAAFSLLGGGDTHISHRHRMRSSIEGLNQEIERLVLRSTPSFGGLEREERKGVENTPEGHRAPVADLLRETRSVNTQTPAFTAPSSGPPSRNSPGGGPFSNISDSRPSSEMHDVSEDSSPEQEGRGLGTSPRINRFLAREPPDGCERVSTRFTEDRRPMVDISEMDYPLKPSMNFQLKPSLGSAFQPLRSTQ
ncbi:unnamed protein product [Nezara viridula]|uniref:Uncharacterized protein n=1 Tax=Nezara viridula TaxID=85310 RepID=A0A9P0HN20_NEZVI|nr:unnamed protein product [Nezara viridula]